MLSRQQIILQLHNLKQFKLVSYKGIVSANTHLVTLIVVAFQNSHLSVSTYMQDFHVTEEAGYLSATTVDGSLKFAKLS